MLNKLKESYQNGYNRGTNIFNNGSDKEWSYLTPEEKRIHLKVRQRLNECLDEGEEVLIETHTATLGVNSSYFFTDKRILVIRPLDMFKTGTKAHTTSHYYNNLSDISLLEYKKKYHEITVAVKGSLGTVSFKVQSNISKSIFDLLNSKLDKNKSGC